MNKVHAATLRMAGMQNGQGSGPMPVLRMQHAARYFIVHTQNSDFRAEEPRR